MAGGAFYLCGLTQTQYEFLGANLFSKTHFFPSEFINIGGGK